MSSRDGCTGSFDFSVVIVRATLHLQPSLRGAKRRSNPPILVWRYGLLRFARNDVGTYRLVLAARFRPRHANSLPPSKIEGAGNAGCALHPRSRVLKCVKMAHTSIQVQRRQSDIPCAMALRLTSCSPRWSGLVVTVTCELLHKLSASVAAPGPHDFAVRLGVFVRR